MQTSASETTIRIYSLRGDEDLLVELPSEPIHPVAPSPERGTEPDPGGAAPPAPAAKGPLSFGYLGFVVSMGLSSLGDAAWYIALAWTLASSTSPATAGAVLALGGLPRLVSLLAGGAMADKYGPRRVMAVTDLLRSGVMLLAAVAVAVTGPRVTVLVAVAATLSLLSAFFIPASGALRPQLLPAKHLVRGNAMYLIGLRGGQAAGGPIGAALMDIGGVVLVACVNAASFVVSAVAVLCVRTPARVAPTSAIRPEEPPTRLLTRIGQGLRHVAGHRRLRLVMIVIGLTELSSAGPLNIGVILFAHETRSAASAAGWLLTAFTAGATVSFLLTLVWPARHRAGLVMVVGIFGQACCLATVAVATSVSWGVGAYFVLGLLSGVVGIVLVSLVQRWSEADMRGRVMSIQALFVYSAVPIGNLLIGVLIELFGFTATLLAHAAVSLAAVGIIVVTTALRSARLA